MRAAVRLAPHPPPLPGAPSIDASYRALTATLPSRLRALARVLPWRLGLTPREDGGWDEFVALHPNRELPVYAAQASAEASAEASAGASVEASAGASAEASARASVDDGGLCLPVGALHQFVRAHHAGGFAWLLRDRLADGQVAADDDLLELSRHYAAHWRETLSVAAADAALVDELAGDAISRWRYATALERRAPGEGKLRPRAYARRVRDKLGWIGVPARALLLARGAPARERAFRRAHDLFLLGLQTIDDVIDREEDGRLLGMDVPRSLGCSPGALLRVAPKLASQAAATAHAAGFSWFGSWLETFAHAIRCWRLDGDAVGDELSAIGIAGEIEEAAVDEDGPIVPTAARPAAPPPA
jgi:hypothetical protein